MAGEFPGEVAAWVGVESLLLYLSLCVVGAMAGFAVVSWAHPAIPLAQRLLLSPVTGLALWAACLGGGVALGITLRSLVAPLWCITVVLAICGLWRLAGQARLEPSPRWHLLIVPTLCLALPVVCLLPFFRYGLADYPGSPYLDGWSYAAYGQFLWGHARFEDGGLAPIDQYATHLSRYRHVSASLLVFFSRWSSLGHDPLPSPDAQAGVGLLLGWALFAFVASCAAFGVSHGLRPAWLACYLLLVSLSGWIQNLILSNNYDNAASLAYFPALAAILAVLRPETWRSGLHLGLLTAGVLYTYVEMAPVVLGGAAVIAAVRLGRERPALRAWGATLVVTMMSAAFLVAPYLARLLRFLAAQATQGLDARVGGGIFGGLLSAAHQPSAFWALGGEHRLASHLAVGNVAGAVLSVLAVLGWWKLLRQRAHAMVLIVAGVLAGVGMMLVRYDYAYGAYKFLLMGWWAVCLLPIVAVGVSPAVARKMGPRLAPALFGVLVLASTSLHAGGTKLRSLAAERRNSMKPVRAVRQVVSMVGNGGLLLAVDDEWLNQWALYYLRDVRLHVGAQRGYVALPKVLPYVQRAAPVPLEELAYVLTDDQLDRGIHTAEGEPIWAGGRYRLWKLPPRQWAVIVGLKNPNGMERFDGKPLMWLGGGATVIEILADRSQTLHLTASILPGPSTPGVSSYRLLLATDSGEGREVRMSPGERAISVNVHAQRNRITLEPLDRPMTTQTPAGDRRPMILGLHGLALRP